MRKQAVKGGQTCFARKNGNRHEVKTIGNPTEDHIPKESQLVESSSGQDKEVSPIGQDRENQAGSEPAVGVRRKAFSRRRELLDNAESTLGKSQALVKMGTGVHRGGKPVAKAPDYR